MEFAPTELIESYHSMVHANALFYGVIAISLMFAFMFFFGSRKRDEKGNVVGRSIFKSCLGIILFGLAFYYYSFSNYGDIYTKTYHDQVRSQLDPEIVFSKYDVITNMDLYAKEKKLGEYQIVYSYKVERISESEKKVEMIDRMDFKTYAWHVKKDKYSHRFSSEFLYDDTSKDK